MVREQLSRFKDVSDLEYRVLYFSIMKKTHIEIETNIMGKECVLYMQPYDNLPLQINTTVPLLSVSSGQSPRLFASCPRKIKFVRGGKCKIRAVWTVAL